MKNRLLGLRLIVIAMAGLTGGFGSTGAAAASASGAATTVEGTITGWPESGSVFEFDVHVDPFTDIQAWWSINTLGPPARGWFYGFNPATKVAHAPGVTDICEITDASAYAYEDWFVGPVSEGDFVLFHNPDTGYYSAFRVDDIYGPSAPSSLLDATWYLQANGGSNFGPCFWQPGIDVKPGSHPNSVNTKSKGVIPVALLTSEDFDATSVDADTMLFEQAAADKAQIEDVDGDGDLDLVLHFRTQDTGITLGDTDACLFGQTYDGVPIRGCDSVLTVQ